MSTATNPDLRAQIIAGVLRHIAETPSAVSYSAVFRRAMSEMGLPEEEIGTEIRNAVSCLIFSGFVLSNSLRHDPMEVYYSDETEMAPGPWLLRFVWGDRPKSEEEDDDGGEA